MQGDGAYTAATGVFQDKCFGEVHCVGHGGDIWIELVVGGSRVTYRGAEDGDGSRQF